MSAELPTSRFIGTEVPVAYTFALSFHGSKRRKVRNVARALAEAIGEDRVFFDEFHKDQFLGAGAKSRFRDIYTNQSAVVVPFFSDRYDDGGWTGYEWDDIRKFVDSAKVKPVALDESCPAGWSAGGVPVDGRKLTGKQIAEDLLTLSGVTVVPSSGVLQQVNAEAQQTNGAAAVESGFIVAVDIWDFAAVPPSHLEAIISAMWESGTELGLVSDVTYGMLDGIISIHRKGDYQSLVDGCAKWIDEFSKRSKEIVGEESIELRVAIHRGDYLVIDKRSVVVGAGPNEASRLVRMAGRRQLVLSERFVTGWKEHVSWKPSKGGELSNVRPRPQLDPIQLHIKDDELSEFRFWRFEGKSPVYGSALRKADYASRALGEIIKQIEEEFVEQIQAVRSSLDAGKLDTRVSVFVADPEDNNTLVSTEFRYIRPQQRSQRPESHCKKGQTTYALRGNSGLPEGPIALAYTTMQPVVCSGLPDFSKQPEKYLSSLSMDPWNLPSSTIQEFGCHARSFLAVPCWLHENAPVPEAVLCIDCMHSLKSVSETYLEDCAMSFGRYYGLLVAALVWIRT